MLSSTIRRGGSSSLVACERCEDARRPWDRIADTAVCPNCIENLMVGMSDHLRFAVQEIRCTLCASLTSVMFQSVPRHSFLPVKIPLCGNHLRALASRDLDPESYGLLKKQLAYFGLSVENIFLLHGNFYDAKGKALQPIVDRY